MQAKILHSLRISKKEWFGFIPILETGRMGNLVLTDHGTQNHVEINRAHLFKKILNSEAHAIYLVHNHPSNDVRVSVLDRILTSQVETILRSLGIEFRGHYIVGPSRIHFFRHAFEENPHD